MSLAIIHKDFITFFKDCCKVALLCDRERLDELYDYILLYKVLPMHKISKQELTFIKYILEKKISFDDCVLDFFSPIKKINYNEFTFTSVLVHMVTLKVICGYVDIKGIIDLYNEEKD